VVVVAAWCVCGAVLPVPANHTDFMGPGLPHVPSGLCSYTCGVENQVIKVTHDTTSGHTQHKCYLTDFDGHNSCVCSCCDGASNDCAEDSNYVF
jgi:hypothetical protein